MTLSPCLLPTVGLDPAALPPGDSAERWPWLQQLRRQQGLNPTPWLEAIEAGHVVPEADLLEVLADQLRPAETLRLLRWWLAAPERYPSLPQRLGRLRNPAVAELLRTALAGQAVGSCEPATQAILLPLLGHQRQLLDFPLFQGLALEAGPRQVRQAALEGLMVGLSAWPLPELRRTLARLVTDLDPHLAAAAVDALARLPLARPQLVALGRRDLDPAVAERLTRRLRAIPVSPLLLLIHGRRGGAIPHELQTLAMEVERRRGAPVLLRTITDPGSAAALPALPSLQLAPLFLLPGTHVRQDLPLLLAQWRRQQPVRAWPFLGAWPRWQQALAQELAGLVRAGSRPRLLHHPVEGKLGARYLAHLERVTQAVCVAAPLSGDELRALEPGRPSGLLPLALAASRLQEELAAALGAGDAAPLLARQRLRTVLLEELCALP